MAEEEIIDKNESYKILKKENPDRRHISFSEFSLFNQCGHRHLLEKHLGLLQQPPSIHLYFGNAIHSTIELSLKESLSIEKRIEYFKATFSKDMMDNMKETNDYKFSLHHFLIQGEQILKFLDLNKILDEYDLVSVEEALYENIFSKYFFKGFIDLVLQNKVTKRYKILDWKTSGEDWDVEKKKKDEIFLCQMRFYKFFWSRKNNIDLDNVDCSYVVLNRLRKKKDPNSYPGNIQTVDINSNKEEIKYSLEKLAKTIKMIHVEKSFPKIKFTLGKKMGCMFCPLKDGKHPMCDSSDKQDKKLLIEHKK
jgi:hypothetical protein